MTQVDLTYGGEIPGMINAIENKKFNINYTLDGKTGKPTTTSILINNSKGNFLMVTFDYQDLKKLVEGEIN